MAEKIINEAIERIKGMEELFSFLLSVPLSERDKFKAEREALAAYYLSESWKLDFELDSKGMLPRDLKRGVLSEDGIHNYLSDAPKDK